MLLIFTAIWSLLVVMFAWFGKNTGPQRVFRAIGYASATLLIPVVLMVSGFIGFAFYKDAEHERFQTSKAPESAIKYDECVSESRAAAEEAIADNKAGKKSPLGKRVTDIELLRELNGCPSKQ